MGRLRYIAASFLCLLPAANCFAETINYTVDPSQSHLAISGTWGGVPFATIADKGTLNPVVDGATGLIDSYGGTITANRDFQTNTLQITGGAIAAADGGFTFTLSDTNPPPNYGIANENKQNQDGALHGFVFSLTGPVISSPSSLFNTSTLSATVASGQFSYASFFSGNPSIGVIFPSLTVITDFGFTDLSGNFDLDPGTGSLINNGGNEILTIPVETALDFIADDQPVDIHFSGNIVAVASVPEPQFLALSTLSLLFMFRRRN